MKPYLSVLLVSFCFVLMKLPAQGFLFGNDLSYVNEMEDCGVVYKENGNPVDPYQLFADHNCGIARLRLWHTPTWYDDLNSGQRYSDLADVRKSILRAKAAGMQVLLDFHLSDNWADPSKQRAPAAWEGVVDNLPLLKDSLYNYISQTLLSLHADGLLPDMVQIGNETNKGILLSPSQDSGPWVLDWPRNAALFKRAIEAVRGVETQTGQSIKVALHMAGPADTGWLMQGFWSNGVTDFDVIGMSYYWAWHKPTDIADAGNIVAQLKQTYPGKQVMIFETGYIWTNQSNDSAGNIISETHPNYSPASPENQRKWLVDMTQEVINKGASGVMYWEPAWVSSTCWTQWGQGSHQEHATFFDFDSNMLPTGGMGWMEHNYTGLNTTKEAERAFGFEVTPDSSHRSLQLRFEGFSLNKTLKINLLDAQGRLVASQNMAAAAEASMALPDLAAGVYYVAVFSEGKMMAARKVWLR
ncbi:MAG: arabinogalactan endo-1,4-beta-galactosidase [Saprospiraceae bacterium]|nr:arabinogalactan endo-1,4-beta-galactosidase [Saprospiraceae bacterium]MCF8252679.1 arabinogalactan endo-1,4-beta-galactosidase [Saprospiraceae bacterium]MCF8282878.1 arabinogalactan endo-1,4-beta-galactosidase [Bacteroidales bacterium]MCF8314251.1 arabinogalactan endo-1,4-beta-galactosidase [Saprospiraceae bacterium]MCF8443067.1 arabinogalactan endo-1,4-beta-galactosidase [Saprospiraceae bacterium]